MPPRSERRLVQVSSRVRATVVAPSAAVSRQAMALPRTPRTPSCSTVPSRPGMATTAALSSFQKYSDPTPPKPCIPLDTARARFTTGRPLSRHRTDTDAIPTENRRHTDTGQFPNTKIINATYQCLDGNLRKTRDSSESGLPPVNPARAIPVPASRRGHGCPRLNILPLTPNSHPPRKMIGYRGFVSCARAGLVPPPFTG